MFSEKWEAQSVMVEIVAVGVQSVVADETIRPEGEGVSLGEGNVHFAVTSQARVRSERTYAVCVAVRTFKGRSIAFSSMTVQGITEGVVGEIVCAEIGERRRLSAVILVAVVAGQVWRSLNDDSVQLRRIAHLIRDAGMTFETAVRHCDALPRRGMAGFALADLRVRVDPADGIAGLGVERAGTEHLRSAGIGDSDEYENCYKSGEDSSAGETAEAIVVSHIPSYFKNVA